MGERKFRRNLQLIVKRKDFFLKKYTSLILLGLLVCLIIFLACYQEAAVISKSKSKDAPQETTVEIEQSKQSSAEMQTADSLTSGEAAKEDEVDFPVVDLNDWSLVLVGPLNKINQEVEQSQLATLSNGYEVDKRIVAAYEQLAQAAEKAGHPLVMISGFRSVATQKQLFDRSVKGFMNQGQTEEEAIAKTKLTMTEPGYSEHHTGLAIDVVDKDWYDSFPSTVLDEQFGAEAGGQWLQQHAREFGFIIRYPKNKEDITKIDYEPWHLRYVGVEVAQYIENHQLTLEEFLQQAKEQEVKNESSS